VERAGSVRFWTVPQYLVSYASGSSVSRAYSLKVQKLGGLGRGVMGTCVSWSDGKDQVGEEKIGRRKNMSENA